MTHSETADMNADMDPDMGPGGRAAPPEGTGSGSDSGSGSTPAAVVTIRIPADPDYVPILRAACGQLAPRLGCTRSETADLRLAVDEACGLLLRNCIRLRRGIEEEDGLTAVFVVDRTSLRVTVEMQADAATTPDADEFGWTILTALVDGFAWRVDETAVSVEIVKKHADGR